MLVIRMQRTGRKGHAQFRVVVQDSRRTPSSGKIVAYLGHFNPHSKETSLDKEKAKFYLDHGAQPSARVARLLKSEGVKLPKWVSIEKAAKRAIKNPEKLRRNRPAEADTPEPAEDAPVEEQASAAQAETAAESSDQPDSTEQSTDEKQAVAEETAAESSEDKKD